MREVAEEFDTQSSDDRVFVRFRLEPHKNEAASLEAGRPKYDETEYLEIQVPGDRTTNVDRPVTDDDRKRFRRQYADWKAGVTQGESGTPLAQWPAVSRSEVEELAFWKVRTVEALASLSDSNQQNIGPIRGLVQKAKDFLEAAKSTAHLGKMREELDQRDAALLALQQQAAAQAKELAELRAEIRGEGPKRKQHKPEAA